MNQDSIIHVIVFCQLLMGPVHHRGGRNLAPEKSENFNQNTVLVAVSEEKSKHVAIR